MSRTTGAARRREAEKGVEALARINATVRACLSATSSNPNLSALLAQVLSSAVEHLNADGGSVWLFDEDDSALLAAEHEGGVCTTAERGREVRAGSARGQLQALATVARERLLLGERPILYQRLEDPAPSAHSDADRYARELRSRGLSLVVLVPIFVEQTHLGTLSLRFREDRALTPENEELAYALANHAALAIQMRQLAEAARDMAVAREREAIAKEREEAERRRADALARVNASFYAMLDRFAEQQDLDTFLGEAVSICAREFDAVGAGIWRRKGPGDHELVIQYAGGAVRLPAEIAYPITLKTAPEDEPPFARGRILLFPIANLHAEPWYRSAQGFELESRNLATLASVPMFVGDRCVGTISLEHAMENPDYTGERRELALALANQIALALELRRLGDEARDAAVAREQARAAQDRATAVGRIGAASRASLDHLAREPDLEVFLGQILAVAAREVGAEGGAFWVSEDGDHRLLLSLEQGAVRMPRRADESSGLGHSTVLSGSALAVAWERIGGQSRGVIRYTQFEDVENDPERAPYLAFMRMSGIRSVLDVPLFLGEAYRGAMTLRFADVRRLTPDEQELVFALTNQAVLALELQRLSKVAREAAVLEERTRIAREIHDTLAQGFAAIRLHVELAREKGLPPHTAEALELAYQIAGENLVETRRSMAVLKSAQPGLATLLSAAIDGIRRLGQGNVVASLEPVPALPSEVAHEFVRIAQEAMLNAARHAEAQTIRVTLTPVRKAGLRLAVVDDGKGFDPGQATPGFGLVGLRERAAAIEAKLSIVSAPGAGTQIVVTWAPSRASRG